MMCVAAVILLLKTVSVPILHIRCFRPPIYKPGAIQPQHAISTRFPSISPPLYPILLDFTPFPLDFTRFYFLNAPLLRSGLSPARSPAANNGYQHQSQMRSEKIPRIARWQHQKTTET